MPRQSHSISTSSNQEKSPPKRRKASENEDMNFKKSLNSLKLIANCPGVVQPQQMLRIKDGSVFKHQQRTKLPLPCRRSLCDLRQFTYSCFSFAKSGLEYFSTLSQAKLKYSAIHNALDRFRLPRKSSVDRYLIPFSAAEIPVFSFL